MPRPRTGQPDKPEARLIKIIDVLVGPRHRKDLGDLTGLADSMRRLGLLHPIVVNTRLRLIAGARRLAAARLLGWTTIRTTIARSLSDATRALQAEAAENTERRALVPSEMVSLARSLEPFEKAEAKARQAHRSGKLPERLKGDRRDRLAVAVGTKGKTLDKMFAVVDAAKRDPARFDHLAQDMDQKGKVDGPFRKLQRALTQDQQPTLPNIGAIGTVLAGEPWSRRAPEATSLHIVVHKNNLLRELQLMSALGPVLIEATADGLHLQAADQLMGLRSRCTATVIKRGTVVLSGSEVSKLLHAAPETDIRIKEDMVEFDRFKCRMRIRSAGDVPILPEPTVPTVMLPRAPLRDMIAKTQSAIRKGALLVLRPGSMSVVATDGHRLAVTTTPRHGDDESRAIVPTDTVGMLGRLLAEGSGDVRYWRGDTHLFFEVGGRLLISRMIDGQVPAYERMIPKRHDKRIEFERDKLVNTVKRVALFSRAVTFRIEKGIVDVTSHSPDLGEAKETLPVEYSGPALHVCFNAQDVLGFLSMVTTDAVSLDLTDDVSPAVMKPIGAEGYDCTYVIMPWRP